MNKYTSRTKQIILFVGDLDKSWSVQERNYTGRLLMLFDSDLFAVTGIIGGQV